MKGQDGKKQKREIQVCTDPPPQIIQGRKNLAEEAKLGDPSRVCHTQQQIFAFNILIWLVDQLLCVLVLRGCSLDWLLKKKCHKKLVIFTQGWGSDRFHIRCHWSKSLGSSAERESSWLAEVHLSSWLAVAWAELESYRGKYFSFLPAAALLFPLTSLLSRYHTLSLWRVQSYFTKLWEYLSLSKFEAKVKYQLWATLNMLYSKVESRKWKSWTIPSPARAWDETFPLWPWLWLQDGWRWCWSLERMRRAAAAAAAAAAARPIGVKILWSTMGNVEQTFFEMVSIILTFGLT